MMIQHFAGMPIVVTEAATDFVGHTFTPIPYSPHRSARIWKRLAKRQRASRREDRRPGAFLFGPKWLIHPEVAAALSRNKEQTK